MNLNLTFRNEEQRQFYWSKKRVNRFGGGFGNGKTFVSCQRALTMLLTFPGYRVAACRQVYKNLRATTMQTFFKICPKELIYSHDEQFGLTVFVNGSRIYWLHLDQMDEATAKGFEINALIIDQAEEVDEPIYMLMDARVGRWDKAEVPASLLKQFPNWPRHPKWKHPLVPNYVDLLDNPSDDEFHWISRYFDADSPERKPEKTHFSIVRQTDDNMNDAATIASILSRDQEWIDKYYFGRKVLGGAMLHRIPPECKIDPDSLDNETWENLLKVIREKAILTRILDHGQTAATVCGFAAQFNQLHVMFGEYYQPNDVISNHRRNIFDLTTQLAGESNLDNFIDIADPSIFKKEPLLKGGFWSIAQEYTDVEEIVAPPIYWGPADNNELATRNRINELLKPSGKWMHPITKESPAPGIYFIMSSKRWPHGCHNIVIETGKQKKKLLGEINGKKYYSDDRDDTVVDHGYDVLRYYVAYHSSGVVSVKSKPAPVRSFANFNRIYKMRHEMVVQG